MSYAWISQVDQPATPGLPTGAFNDLNPSATRITVDPAEDWEKATRSPRTQGKTDDALLWQPVYVQLAPAGKQTVPEAAKALQNLFTADKGKPADKREIAPSNDAMTCLAALVANPPYKGDDHLCLRFVIFRREDVAYSATVHKKPAPFAVLQVGPAIPFAAVELLLLPQARILSADIEVTGGAAPCVTALIDDQIGFLNERFRDRSGDSRIARLYLMGQPAFANGTYVTEGEEFGRPAVDKFIRHSPWEEEGYERAYPSGVRSRPAGAQRLASGLRATDLADPDFRRPFAFQAGHGTHMLDLAAGFPQSEAADDRPIFAVQLPRLIAAETSGARLDLYVLMALKRILHWADSTYVPGPGGAALPAPVVVSISYGFLAGPKDGRGFLEAEIARLIGLRTLQHPDVPTLAVIPSGNGFRSRTRARIKLTKAARTQTVTLRHQPEDLSASFVELWLDKGDEVTLTVTPPVGPSANVNLRTTPQVIDWQVRGATVGRLYVQADAAGDRTRAVLALAPTLNHVRPEKTAPAGGFGLTLELTAGKRATIDIDVQRDDTPSTFPAYGRQAYLDHPEVDRTDPETFDIDMPDPQRSPVTRAGTLSAMATGGANGVIVVGGAFDRHAYEQAALYAASGAGLPFGGPHLSAISEETRAHPGRLATGLYSGSASTFSGTSTAAPQVARALVSQIATLIAAGRPPVADLPALLNPGQTLPAMDDRLGVGIMALRPQQGRPPRRDPP